MNDQQMWDMGFMPAWLKHDLRSVMKPMILPPWLGGPPMQMERWLPFRCGTYEVSSRGGVRRAAPGTGTFKGRPLALIVASNGYPTASLSTPSGKLRMYVHRMVAEAFLGPCPDGHVVNHVGVSVAQMSRIVRGLRWSHVDAKGGCK